MNLQIPSRLHLFQSFALMVCSLMLATYVCAAGLEPIPDKLVVLTFDDSVKSHFTIARPILKKHGFGATFFITEGFDFKTDKEHYMTWEEIAQLHHDGFEIGNHTRDHMSLNPAARLQLTLQLRQLREQIEVINQRCEKHGIPRTVSFAYPGNGVDPGAYPILKAAGIRFARRGGSPEYKYPRGRGFAFEPGADHPLLVPSAGDARPDWKLEDLKRAVDQAKFGRIAVLQFHGVPDVQHAWVNTPKEKFEEFMDYLAEQKCRVISMRDLAKFVDPDAIPKAPGEVIERRQKAVTAGDVSRYFKTLATEGSGPSGFSNPAAVKLAIATKLLPLVDREIPVPDTVAVERGIEYGRGGEDTLRLDLYSPKDRDGDAPVPGLIFIHGGAWKSGERSDYHLYGLKFAQCGYVVATITYRLLPGAVFPAAVEDSKCAVRWMRANAAKLGIDPDRIAVAGGSAGGHLATMVAYSADVAELEGEGGHAGVSSRVQAVVNLYGAVDLTTPFASQSTLVRDFLGGRSFAEAARAYRLASPLTHLTPDDPPSLTFHGTIDDIVPIAQADLMAEKLKALGIPFRYDRLDGWPHGLDLARKINERVCATMLEFFEEQLAPAPRPAGSEK